LRRSRVENFRKLAILELTDFLRTFTCENWLCKSRMP
jgi:hypothetical protein